MEGETDVRSRDIFYAFKLGSNCSPNDHFDGNYFKAFEKLKVRGLRSIGLKK